MNSCLDRNFYTKVNLTHSGGHRSVDYTVLDNLPFSDIFESIETYFQLSMLINTTGNIGTISTSTTCCMVESSVTNWFLYQAYIDTQ